MSVYQEVSQLQSSLNFSPNALLTTFIGNKGSGKNTLSTLCVQIAAQESPLVKRFANTHITNAIYVPDILKFLATKYIMKDFAPIEVDIDEAALAGLESRGSFSKDRALDSYLFTLARKARANVRLLSQLLSMVEKRTQWISDYYVLCESSFGNDPHIPERFVYTVFDTNLKKVNQFDVYGEDAAYWLFTRYRTQEIPFQDQFAKDLTRYYGVTDDDCAAFDEIMGIVRKPDPDREKNLPETKTIMRTKSLYVNSIIVYEGKRWVVVNKEFDANHDAYNYDLEGLPE
jgi:hypothetical protein